MTEPFTVSAAEMARLVASSPGFRLPDRPRLLPGIVVIPVEQGLVLEGAERRQVLRGPGVASLLPWLLPLLDGTRTCADVRRALPGVPGRAVEDALALLYTRGVLEDGAAAAWPDEPRHRAVRDFMHRHVDVTRVNSSAGEAFERLRAVPVAVAGDTLVLRYLGKELAACGVTVTSVADAGLFVRVLLGEDDPAALTELDGELSARGVPWLRVSLRGSELEIGPYFSVPRAVCYHCFASAREPSQAPCPAEPAWIPALAALAAAEIVFVTSRICAPLTRNGVLRLDLEKWSDHRSVPVPRPSCPACCPPGRSRPDSVSTAFAYEQAISTALPEFTHPKERQVHYAVANRELQRPGRGYPGFRKEPLGGGRQPSDDAANTGLDRASLGRLLTMTAGLRTSQPPVRRWVPSAGNLGSVQVYVLAHRVAGLGRGWYAYAAFQDALLRMEPPGPEADAGPSAHSSGAGEPLATLVLTADLQRASAKYGPAAYHLVHLDAGAALAQCQAVGRPLGLTVSAARDWDDVALGTALSLDLEAEPITAVISLLRSAVC